MNDDDDNDFLYLFSLHRARFNIHTIEIACFYNSELL